MPRLRHLLGLGLSLIATGQADIGGQVLNALTAAPIAGATVKYGASTATTDAQGRFLLSGVAVFHPRGSQGISTAKSRSTFFIGTDFPDGPINGYNLLGRNLDPDFSTAQPLFLTGATGKAQPVGFQTALSKFAAPCLLSATATGYKPGEANCAEGLTNVIRLASETATRFVYQIPVDAGDALVPGDLYQAVPVPRSVLDLMDSLAAGRYREVHSLLIIRGGKLVLEEYYRGSADTIDFEHGILRVPLGNISWKRTDKHYLASANKALTGIVVGQALASSGRTVSATLASLLPQYQAYFTGTKTSITVHHALTMTMGLQWDEWSSTDLAQMWAGADIGTYALAKPMAATPGTQWIYNSAGPNLLLAALQTAVGESMATFAATNLYALLGIEDYRWGRQPNGLPEGSARMFMRPRDMAKIGLLMLGNGLWQGQQVVPAAWVTLSTQKHLSALPKSPNDYGYLWWVRKLTTPRGTVVDYYQAEGDGGQYIVVFPGQDLVVVATGGNYGDFGTYDTQMTRILSKHVLPGLNL